MIMTSVHRWTVSAILCVLAAAAGCGGPYDATASGKVTLDGTIVPRGIVAFHAVSGGPPAIASIGASGEYVVRTGREEGLPSGEYQLTVVANEPPAIEKTAQGGPPPPGKPLTPAWYRSKETSGLKYTVESGSNEINLELSSQPPAGWNPRGKR